MLPAAMVRILLLLSILSLIAGCTSSPTPPPHPARALTEAVVLPRLADSATYVFTDIIVDTVTAAEDLAKQIAIAEDRQRQYDRRILLKAEAMLSAAGTEVSREAMELAVQMTQMTQPYDTTIRVTIDSLKALSGSTEEVIGYAVVLSHRAKNEQDKWEDMLWDVTFDANWQVVEVSKF